MDKIYARNQDFVQREVAGEFLLIPLQRRLTDTNSLYVLNETAAALWRAFDGQRTLREIMDEFSLAYEVPRERLEQDVATLVDDLLSIHALIEAGG